MGRRQSRRAGVALAVIALILLIVAPSDIGARAAVSAIDFYRARISPHLSRVVTCRFQPTCSMYARTSIQKYGLVRGGARSAVRIAKCGPWTPAGTVDLP